MIGFVWSELFVKVVLMKRKKRLSYFHKIYAPLPCPTKIAANAYDANSLRHKLQIPCFYHAAGQGSETLKRANASTCVTFVVFCLNFCVILGRLESICHIAAPRCYRKADRHQDFTSESSGVWRAAIQVPKQASLAALGSAGVWNKQAFLTSLILLAVLSLYFKTQLDARRRRYHFVAVSLASGPS